MADEGEFSGAAPGGHGAQGERPDIRTILLALIALVLVGWALRAMAAVAIPVVASILIALAVMPVRDWVRRRLPEKLGGLGIVAAMTLLLLVVAVFAGALWLAAQQVAAQLPGGGEQGVELLTQGGEATGDGSRQALPLGLPADVTDPADGAQPSGEGASAGGGPGVAGLLEGRAGDLAARFGDTVIGVLADTGAAVLNSAMAIGSALVVIFFLVLLILIESGDWRQKIATVTRRRDEWRLTESAEVIAQKVRTYLLIRAVLGAVTAVLYGLWLWFFGAGLIIVWAILTFLLNFVPTVGSIVAGLLPVIYVLITQDAGTAAAVGVGILVIEQVMGNYVDPRVSGNRIAVSPLVVLVALLFWAWVWGIPGALLAAPVTVSLIVLGAHVPVLRPWALLLSDRTDMQGLKDATRPK
ncbi:AI-2E family transporter [Paracoccus luteus]|uniref:AI-2E family transporter n=1 Tax=Paracoccus luteus TaxID=2508543 RepID=UPI00106F42F1|nr:AI-2E family transporter [Paracoccus luteus]